MRRPEFLARHGRRPEGWFGRILAKVMAWETSEENDAALELLEVRPGDRVLEIGFGHGRSINAAARLTRGGLVAGVDFSPSMVAMARRRNHALADRRLVDLRQGNSLCLPFEDDSFDRAWSVHTVYFWDEPVAHMKEVGRVLKDGGRFVLGFRPSNEEVQRAPGVYVHVSYGGRDPADVVRRGLSPRESCGQRRRDTRGRVRHRYGAVLGDSLNNTRQHETSP